MESLHGSRVCQGKNEKKGGDYFYMKTNTGVNSLPPVNDSFAMWFHLSYFNIVVVILIAVKQQVHLP